MLTIRHDHQDGTRIEGSVPGDGVLGLLEPHGFTYRRFAGIHIRGSRDQFSDQYRIERAADALRAAGHEVDVVIDDQWRPAAVREADRGERVEARVERLTDRAERAGRRATAARDARRRIGDGIPMGQPLLVGHHSYPRALRDQQRMETLDRRHDDEAKYAATLADRATGSAASEAAKHNPRAITGRIEALETNVRLYRRQLNEVDASDARRTRCQLLIDRDSEEIAWLRGKLDAMAAEGTFAAWGPDNIAKGDQVRSGGWSASGCGGRSGSCTGWTSTPPMLRWRRSPPPPKTSWRFGRWPSHAWPSTSGWRVGSFPLTWRRQLPPSVRPGGSCPQATR